MPLALAFWGLLVDVWCSFAHEPVAQVKSMEFVQWYVDEDAVFNGSFANQMKVQAHQKATLHWVYT